MGNQVEVVAKKRGRQPGSVKSVTLIKDPILGKYHIEIDDNEFAVVEEGKQQPLSHCTSLGRALYRIAQAKLVDNAKTMTIREYITELKYIQTQMEDILK